MKGFAYLAMFLFAAVGGACSGILFPDRDITTRVICTVLIAAALLPARAMAGRMAIMMEVNDRVIDRMLEESRVQAQEKIVRLSLWERVRDEDAL